MSGQAWHGFIEPEVDYRHAQLMSDVAQRIEVRRPRRHLIHDVLAKPRRHHLTRAVPCP